MDQTHLDRAVRACRELVERRFPGDDHAGAAAMLLDDETVLTGTAPAAVNASVQVCHETEPYAAAHRLGRRVAASVCLHRKPGAQWVVLSPCGVCRERLAEHGPGVLVATAGTTDPSRPRWRRLEEVLPDYWMAVFPEELTDDWAARP